MSTRFSSATLAFLIPLLGADASAQPEATPEAVSTLVVTGEFRATDLTHLPASVSLISDRTIAARNAQHFDQLIAAVPNLHYAGGTSRGRYFQIRGIGERSEFARPLNASVGMLIDGVDFSGLGGAATLHDVEQIEVFRGPQGTRYGANGLAGVINVVTRAPTSDFEAGVVARAANHDSRGLGGYVSGPASETVSYRLSAERYRSDGFMRNVFLDRRDTNGIDERTLRGRLRWEPRPGASVDLMLAHVDADNGFDAFSLDNTRRTLSDEPGYDRQRSTFGSAAVSFEASERFWLEGQASHARSKSHYGYDEDWTFTGFHERGYTSFDDYRRDHRRSTAEIRLLSTEAGRLLNESTHWVVGAYAYDQSVEFRREYTFLSAPFDSTFDVRRYALFGQTETPLGDALTLTLGLRLERHLADYDDSQGVAFDPDDNLLGARVALDYLLGSDTILYASAGRGYKAGGFNPDSGLDGDRRRFDPEVLYNTEVGVKGSWRDDTLNGRISLFYMRRHDAQLSTSEQRVRDDGSTEFIQYTANTGRGSDNYGTEAELEWRPLPAVSLSAAVGLLRAEYGDYVNERGIDLSGRRQPHAPSYQFHTAAEYRFGGGAYLRAEFEGRAGFYFSDEHDARADAHELVHLSVGWRAPQWTIELWGRNVLDEDYAVRGFSFGNDPRKGYARETYVQWGEPRRMGVTGSWRM